jgi:hypothetical protein
MHQLTASARGSAWRSTQLEAHGQSGYKGNTRRGRHGLLKEVNLAWMNVPESSVQSGVNVKYTREHRCKGDVCTYSPAAAPRFRRVVGEARYANAPLQVPLNRERRCVQINKKMKEKDVKCPTLVETHARVGGRTARRARG